MKKYEKLQPIISDSSKSVLKKYQEVATGSGSLLELVRYELTILLLGNLPGAIGLLLRKIFYRGLFKSAGKNVLFGRGLTIRHPAKITIGDNVVIDDYCVLDAKGEGNPGIRIGDNSFITRNTVLGCKNGSIEIGSGVSIGNNCIVHSIDESSVKIGDNVVIAAYCYIVGGGNYHSERLDMPIALQGTYSKGGIEIGDGVWLGASVKVLDGVRVGKDSIIGTGAVVNRDVPDFAVAVGAPAKVIKSRLPQRRRDTEQITDTARSTA